MDKSVFNLKDVVVVSTSSSRNVGRVDVIVYVAVCLCELGFFHKWILRPGLASWATAQQRKYSEDIALLVVHFAAEYFFFMLCNCYINNVGRSLPTPLVGLWLSLDWANGAAGSSKTSLSPQQLLCLGTLRLDQSGSCSVASECNWVAWSRGGRFFVFFFFF